MRKYVILLLAIVIAVSFCGCRENTIDGSGDKLSIITTIFPAYDFARSIGGDMVHVEMLISPGNEVHTFEPTPQDIIKISNCDLFIYNGGESDEWVKTVLDGLDKDINTLDFMSCIETDKNIHDEHVWTSPKNVMNIVNKISATLCEIDFTNKEYYKENEKIYSEKLQALDKSFSDITENAKRRELVFADRFPFAHFADRYNLEYISAYPGCAEEAEVSASTISDIIEKVKKERLPVVFKMELSNDNIAKTICEETGARLEIFHSCHNLSTEEFENGATYLNLMQKNAEILKEALN